MSGGCERELDEETIRQEFIKFHDGYAQVPYVCNLTKFAKDMGISRIKIYRWLKKKTHLTQDQLKYLKNILTKTIFGFIVIFMIHSCLYCISGLWNKLTQNLHNIIRVAVTIFVTSALIFLSKITQFFNINRTAFKGAVFYLSFTLNCN